MFNRRGYGAEIDLYSTTEKIGKCRPSSSIRNVRHPDAGQHVEQFAGYVAGSPDAARRHVDFSRVGPRVGNEFENRIGRERWMHDHGIRVAHEASNWRNVAD